MVKDLPVLKFRNFDEVIKMANDCDYPLSAYWNIISDD